MHPAVEVLCLHPLRRLFQLHSELDVGPDRSPFTEVEKINQLLGSHSSLLSASTR